MSLASVLSIATGGLANINRRLNVVSNNVANANTPDYSAETSNQVSVVAGSIGMGVRSEPATRAVNLAMQQAAFQQDSIVSGLATTTTALKAIDSVLGTPGQGNDLPNLLGAAQSAFSALMGDPSSGPLRLAVVNAAGNLTGGVNAMAAAYTHQRQAAQTGILNAVTSANASLAQIGTLSNHIIAARGAGMSTADLENQRDAAVHALGAVLSVKALNQPNGDMIISAASGSDLPTRAVSGPLATGSVTIGPGTTYPTGIPGVLLNGIDITSQLGSGKLGANIALRDRTLPTFQAELDEFSFQLSSRFSAQGLNLFTFPDGTIPAGGGAPAQASYVGYATAIGVNPAVIADPSLVRDGTQAIAGSPTGASAFTPNPAGGPAGFNGLISRILTFAFGAEAQTNVAQPASATAGLGPNGDLIAPYTAPATIAANATALVSAQSAVSAAADGRLNVEQTVQTSLTSSLAAASGVNIDQELAQMIQLQNAYGANARIISTVQSMFTQLLQTIP